MAVHQVSTCPRTSSKGSILIKSAGEEDPNSQFQSETGTTSPEEVGGILRGWLRDHQHLDN